MKNSSAPTKLAALALFGAALEAAVPAPRARASGAFLTVLARVGVVASVGAVELPVVEVLDALLRRHINVVGYG